MTTATARELPRHWRAIRQEWTGLTVHQRFEASLAYLLTFVVTAVIVGGTSISGGKGTIIGTLLAVVLLGMIGNVLTLLKLGPDAVYWERAIQGGFILLAVLADHLGGRHRVEGAT